MGEPFKEKMMPDITRHDEAKRTTYLSAEARHYAWLLVAHRYAEFPNINIEEEFQRAAMAVATVYAKLTSPEGLPIGVVTIRPGLTFPDWKIELG